ncbi:hypothetical protein [Amycolatopsis speibonae]|uniref:Secreted protein n=1 Tax=Amycolatopsis speibonae TaxID=1450224 RepID=A0ABV7P922_9PSEU
MRNSARLLGLAVIAIVFSPILSGAVAGASVSDDQPPPIVEDYTYPGADQIFAQYGIRLLKGNGQILFTQCGSGGNLVEVWSRTKSNPFCFKISGNKGYLTLDLAAVYLIKGDDHALKATMVIKGSPVVSEIGKNTWTSAGEGADPVNGQSPLVELNSGSL